MGFFNRQTSFVNVLIISENKTELDMAKQTIEQMLFPTFKVDTKQKLEDCSYELSHKKYNAIIIHQDYKSSAYTGYEIARHINEIEDFYANRGTEIIAVGLEKWRDSHWAETCGVRMFIPEKLNESALLLQELVNIAKPFSQGRNKSQYN